MSYFAHGKERTVDELIAMGYRLISRKYGLISRVDRPDWNQVLLNKNIQCASPDFYRRVHSDDVLEVSVSDGLKFPSSSDRIGYVEVK